MLSRMLPRNIARTRYALHDQGRIFARLYWVQLRLLSSIEEPVAYIEILWNQARNQTNS